jgi:hypothetical protein
MDFGGPKRDFEEADRRYVELKRRHAAGDITEEELDALLKRSMVQDERGRWWAKSPNSGEWHYNDGTTWVKGIPPTVHSTPRAPSSTEERVSEYQPHLDQQEAWWRQKEVIGAIAATFAGATWIVLAFAIAVVRASVLLIAGPLLLVNVGTLVGLMGLRMQQVASYRGLATAGFLVAAISIACLLIINVVLLITSAFVGPGLLILIWVLLCLGFILIGVAYLRARVLPPWASIALILGVVLQPIVGVAARDSYLMESVATFVFGFIWLALSYAIWLRRRAANP